MQHTAALSIDLPAPAAVPAGASHVSCFHLRLERQEGVWLDHAPIASPAQAAERFDRLLPRERPDAGGALYLDGAGAPIGYRVGDLRPCAATGAELRDLLAAALLSGAAALFLAHRLATGELAARRAELDRIRELVRLGRAAGLELLDYLLLGPAGRFTSLQDEFPELWLCPPPRRPPGRSAPEE
jgi:DNA repair protein RadC